ncbi:MAG: hypothetical protein ACP5FL_05525, partial [Thermoplasmatota archaeon]
MFLAMALLSPAASAGTVSAGEARASGVVTLHALSGGERFRCVLPSTPASMAAADVWDMIPEKLRVSLQMQVEEAREKLRAPAGVPLLGDFNLSISIFCSVTGIGVLFMVPFLPVTPLRFSTFSFLSPFVGISLY